MRWTHPVGHVATQVDDESKLIDARIAELNDWRGAVLAHLRSLIKGADADVVEEVKWRKPTNPLGVPLWSHNGMICTGEVYQDKVKLTFAKGASLRDPANIFNASLDAGTRRAIDIFEGDEIDAKAFQALVREAINFNAAAPPAKGKAKKAPATQTDKRA